MVTNNRPGATGSPLTLSPLRWLWERRNIWERVTIALLAARITSKARRLRKMRHAVGGKTRWTMDVDAFLELNPDVLYDTTVWPVSLARALELSLDSLLRSAP